MSTPMPTSSINPPAAATSANSIHANVIPSEVGWQFVPQYYTFVNKQPHRLHCFYTKNSTFIHGTEGEDGRPCYGQQEIHNKILSIGFKDCKVFIHSVDAQSSANGGIIIQVIGEMSNRGEPWRKFAQTFFLAEQPNGYFVLNDIFRFLKEESVEADEEEPSNDEKPTNDTAPCQPEPLPAPTAEPAPVQIAQEDTETPAAPIVQAVHPTAVPSPYNPALPDHPQPSLAPVAPETAPAPVEPEPAEPVPPVPAVEGKKVVQPNGIHPPAAPGPEPAPVTVPAPAPVPLAEPAKQEPPPPLPPAVVEPAVRPVTPSAPADATATTPAVTAAPTTTAPTPATAPTKSAPAPAPSPKPTAPPAPKTWANLAAANSNKWGPQVAQEARGVSAAPPAPPPAPKTEAPVRAEKDPSTARDMHPAYQAALSVATPQCFVKSVTEVISHAALSSTLTSRFGPIKELEIVRNKACAFLEFTTLDAARRAIAASLPIQAGGEGGVRIEIEGGNSARISVETRKERGERPPPRPRTGVPPGQERGGFRGGPGRGRGAGTGGTGRGAGKP